MSRVMLVVPTSHFAEGGRALSFSDFPSGLGYLAGSLKQGGHEVIGANLNNIPGYASPALMVQVELTAKIKEHKPDLIGFSGLCTDFPFLAAAIGVARKAAPNTPIALGGQIVTNDADDVFTILQPDYAVKGEGEGIIVALADDIQAGQKPPAGIIKSDMVLPIDDLPVPDYEPFGVQAMLDDYSMETRLLYRYSRAQARPFIILASRGCPFSCTFCIHGHREIPYRARSIAGVMDEIKLTYAKYRYNVLILIDELFAVNKKRMAEFNAAMMHGRKEYGWDFDWCFQTHASAKLDGETLAAAKEAGCYLFSYGLESAAPDVLKSMNKRIEVSQVIEAMELARKASVAFSSNLIFGDPAETERTWAQSLAFWLKHGQCNFTFLSSMMPYPGSKVFADCQKAGMFQDKRKFYAEIDRHLVNMTKIPDKDFAGLANLTQHLEQSWMFVPKAEKTMKEPDGRRWLIRGTCPYCAKESTYSELIPKPGEPFFVGTGCQHCNGRMRIDV